MLGRLRRLVPLGTVAGATGAADKARVPEEAALPVAVLVFFARLAARGRRRRRRRRRRRGPLDVPHEETRKFDERLDKPIFRLYSILREKGIRVLGITSERQMGQDFIAAIPFCGLRENVKILYVGQHKSFTKRRRNQTLSVLPIDKRYKENEGENLLND